MPLILIADDDPSILALLHDALGEEGHVIVGVGNGHAVLAAIETARPDCILLDLNMPLLDGHEVLARLAAQAEPPPVLLMTSDPRGQRLGPTDGVMGHIPKPFDLDHVSAAVAMITQVILPHERASGLASDGPIGI